MRSIGWVVVALSLAAAPAQAALGDWFRGGVQVFRGLTVNEEQAIEVARQYRAAEDAQQQVAGPDHPMARRLVRITRGVSQWDGIPLEYKVFLDGQVNASAVQSGQIRVHSGLMELMADEEILCVIGHEIGHVANDHQVEKMRNGSLAAGLLDLTKTAQGGRVDNRILDMGATVLFARYSRSKESSADAYGLDFMIDNDANPWACPAALEKLASGPRPPGAALFATHPDPMERAAELRRRIEIMGRFNNYPRTFEVPPAAKRLKRSMQ